VAEFVHTFSDVSDLAHVPLLAPFTTLAKLHQVLVPETLHLIKGHRLAPVVRYAKPVEDASDAKFGLSIAILA